MAKILQYGNDARERVLAGVEKLAATVRVTMGPRGRNVIVGRTIGAPTITKDGVSVAREVVLDDPIEELGCQLVKEAAGRTAAVAGDGTTTATVLTHAIFKQGLALMNSGYSPLQFRSGMDWAKTNILSELSRISKPLSDNQTLYDIATISTNNDPSLGKVIAEAYIAVDREGMVTAESAPGEPDSVRVVDGIELSSGYLSQNFLNKDETKRDMSDVKVLIFDWEITTHAETDFQNAMRKLSGYQGNILLLCRDLKKEGLAFFSTNFQAGRLNVCAIKIPNFGKNKRQWLEDFAALTSSTIIGGEYGISLSDFELTHMGSAKRIIVEEHRTKVVGPNKNSALISHRLALYRAASLQSLGDMELKDLRDRMGFLTSKFAVITVGYSTELELREKADRVEDAVFAVKAAIDEGFVVGGGHALWQAAEETRIKMLQELPMSQWPAAEVLINACTTPAKQIILNAGQNPEEILGELEVGSPNYGYNTATEQYGDLIQMGVVDPKKVTRAALENAVSIAYLLLTTDAVIADDPYRQSGWQPPAGYRLPNETGLNHKH
jgi:chaperonin GroEL